MSPKPKRGEGEAPAEPISGRGRSTAEREQGRALRRGKPQPGVHTRAGMPTIVFVTVGTKFRKPFLASPEYHDLLHDVWRAASYWRVGRYVIMPDHVHFFAAPLEPEFPFENWMRYWRSQFTRRNPVRENRFLQDAWHTRMRSAIAYQAKWDYVLHNPIRHQLATELDEWPYQGELNEMGWLE